MRSFQEEVESILRDDPKMPTRKLIVEYLRRFAKVDETTIIMFMQVLHLAYIPSIVRYAAKYRQKLGIRDETRQKMAEQEKRYWPEQKNLEPNPPVQSSLIL